MLKRFVLLFLLSACAGMHGDIMPSEFIYCPVDAGAYQIATWQKISDTTSPIYIYIEGDGHAFNSAGYPTSNPTPRGKTVRNMAMRDPAANVAYIARPCQFIMSDACLPRDWTTGRFSSRVVDAMADTIRNVAGQRPIILIGYSGGAMISGLVIEKNSDLNVQKWVTVAGVLNHIDWTGYFGDDPLPDSLNMNELPQLPQRHFIAATDTVVPYELSVRWLGAGGAIIIPDARHNSFENLAPDFAHN